MCASGVISCVSFFTSCESFLGVSTAHEAKHQGITTTTRRSSPTLPRPPGQARLPSLDILYRGTRAPPPALKCWNSCRAMPTRSSASRGNPLKRCYGVVLTDCGGLLLCVFVCVRVCICLCACLSHRCACFMYVLEKKKNNTHTHTPPHSCRSSGASTSASWPHCSSSMTASLRATNRSPC